MFYDRQVFKNFIVRLQKKIDSWGGERVLIYSAGMHSEEVMKRVDFKGVDLLGFIDRAPIRQQSGFLGYPVFSPEKSGELDADRVVISSFSFQEEIFSDFSKTVSDSVDIVKFYTEQDQVEFIKNEYALYPCEDSVRPDFPGKKDNYIIPVKSGGSPRILLIQPPFSFANRRHKKILPMNLLYVAAHARETCPGAVIQILDGQVNDLTLSEMKLIVKSGGWDIIGIGYWTGQAETVFDLSRFIRENTKSLLVHGGAHPTLCPEEASAYCDLIVLNEGERTFSEIAGNLDDREKLFSISGIAYKYNGSLKHNIPRPPEKDLDTFPLPAFDLIPDINIYNSPMHVTGGLRVPLIGSRGCPYSCSFCSSPIIWNRLVRWRSPSNVVDEMEMVVNFCGITQFHFWDDNIMMKRAYIEGICTEILERGLNVNWCGLTRASHVIKQKELLPLMKRAGCVGIEIGIESFTTESSDIAHKGEGTGEMKEASRLMEEAEIAPLYTHMLFNPGENIDGYRAKQLFLNSIDGKNSAYLADSRLGQASTPHRKTVFEREAKELGEVYLKGHASYVHHRINFIPNSLLDDVPEKISAERGTPVRFLEIILQALFDWSPEMIDSYLNIHSTVWDNIDGFKSVRVLSDNIVEEEGLDNYVSRVLVSLIVAGLARDGRIRSASAQKNIKKVA